MDVPNPFGPKLTDDGVRFALWAPAARKVSVAIDGHALQMDERDGGWFERVVHNAGAGTRYAFEIDGDYRVPDPASRFQPEGINGPSEVIDTAALLWPDQAWQPRPWEQLVFYELHVGAFSPQGTYEGVEARLDYLANLGVTALELMPLAAAPGQRGWGYDGVLPYAPDARYGRPEELRALIAAAHARGLCVFLDVVYNHFGPEGNWLWRYAPRFFTDRFTTPWGAAIDFSVPEVRAFFVHNATYWLREYGFDGLRLDAIHAIRDGTDPDIVEEIGAHIVQAGRRTTDGRAFAVLENDDNAARYLKVFAAQWNDDAHHALHVLLTGERDGYFTDYALHPIAWLARTLTEGYAYQGEASLYRGGVARGEASAWAPLTSFVTFLQNHDQIGNRPFGERLDALANERAVRAGAAVLFLAPSLPLLFMGEEWGAGTPFLYFCDFEGDLATAVREGRAREFEAFVRGAAGAGRTLPDPGDPETFERSKLQWDERERAPHRELLEYHRALLQVRAREIAPRIAGINGRFAHADVLGERELRAYFRLNGGALLHLRANLGPESREGFGRPEGSLVFASDPSPDVAAALADGTLPGWTVTWHLT